MTHETGLIPLEIPFSGRLEMDPVGGAERLLALKYDDIMKNEDTIVLFDSEENHGNLLPLSYTRPVSDFRLGIMTLREKWEWYMPGNYEYLTVDFLRPVHAFSPDPGREYLFLAGCAIAGPEEARDAAMLRRGEAVVVDGRMLAARLTYEEFVAGKWIPVGFSGRWDSLQYVFDVFLKNPAAIEADFRALTEGRTGCCPGPGVVVLGPDRQDGGAPSLFIEDGATVEGCVINVKDGPVYIGRDAVVMEGSCLRGPLALCHDVKIRMGAKVYGGSTFGPYCKVGGETDNVVMFGYSNKAHDGYLGNSVIGEWCNIGAGVNASNLKNNYAKIRVWNYLRRTFMRTDLQFCGLIMGDHSKAGINCMFNTASVVGVGVNVYGSGFPRVFIPSFSEGSPSGGFSDVSLKNFFDVADRVMARRGKSLSVSERELYGRVYEAASGFK